MIHGAPSHGILLAELGRNPEVLHELEAAVRLDPTLTGLHNHLGLVLTDLITMLGRMDRAEQAYRQALALDPGHADTCDNLGVLLAQRGNLEAAHDLFRRAVAADPEHVDAADNLRRARRLLGG